ncbi:MAG TPA: PAS domain S-box protein [Pyrinomonadaceae bacterium]|nr:PAS domain S-box protein [Pyrinomonadaceae bacterium]
MSTSAKLWLGFGLLTGLLMISSGAIILRVWGAGAQVSTMSNVDRPRMSAARQLETAVVGYALAVRHRFQEPRGIASTDDAIRAESAATHLGEYERLAVTPRQAEHAERFAAEWREFHRLGQAILASDAPGTGAMESERFYRMRLGLENLLNDIQADAVATYDASRDAALADVEAVYRLALIFLVGGTIIAVSASVIIGRAIVGAEARKAAMFETALDSVISIDHRGIVTEFNPAAEETFGYTRADVIGRELAELIIPEEMREAHRRGLAHYLKTGEGPVLERRIEISGLRADGSEFPVELAITRIPVGGMPQFTAYLRDITARKAGEDAMLKAREMLEQRVDERTTELKESNLALERSNKDLEQFAAVASHDLQEPLRKIQAFGDRLRERSGDEIGEEGLYSLERMIDAASRMRGLIEALLTFSRVTTKAQRSVPVDLGAAAREVVSDLEALIHKTAGRVEVGALPTIAADPQQMRQLLLNLIANGLKFHKPGVPPVVRVEGRMLAVDSEKMCELSVSDNGIGFDEQYRERIFEVFERVHSRQQYEGTGMGLAICRRIAERHGGTVSANAGEDGGATFLVKLPVRQPVR